jgi:hypothetical protein
MRAQLGVQTIFDGASTANTPIFSCEVYIRPNDSFEAAYAICHIEGRLIGNATLKRGGTQFLGIANSGYPEGMTELAFLQVK